MRSIVPYDWPLTEEAFHRLHHADVARLTSAQIWSESLQVRIALSARVFGRCRDRALFDGLRVVSESVWLHQRLSRLNHERLRRAGGREAAAS